MINLIQKHKIFLLTLLALITMLIGFCFVGNEVKVEDSDAAKYYFTLTYSTKWKNPNGTTGFGSYKNTSGDEFNSSVGSVSIGFSDSKGASISGTLSSDTYTSTGNASCTAGESNGAAWWIEVDFTVTCNVNAITGFDSNLSTTSWIAEGDQQASGSDSDSYHVEFFPKQYDITYNTNGGSLSNSSQSTIKTYFYERYTLPTVQCRAGYIFKGWYTASSGGTKIESTTCFSNVDQKILYAQWEVENYTLVFNKEEGSGGLGSTTVTYGTIPRSIIDEDLPSRTGYTFQGYYTEKNGSGDLIFRKSGAPNEYASNYFYRDPNGRYPSYWKKDLTPGSEGTALLNLYAHWTANTYNFFIDYGSNSSDSDAYCTNLNGWETDYYGAVKAITFDQAFGNLPVLNKTGYTFSHYSYNGEKITSSTILNFLPKEDYQTSWPTLTNHWTENSYTIKFDANGGSGTMENKTLKYTEKYPMPNCTFKRPGYIFKGWHTSSTIGSNEKFTKVGTEVYKLRINNNDQITYYAIWQETWTNSIQTPAGSGTQTSPYLIESEENLAWIARQTEEGINSFERKYFKQTSNLDLNDYVWKPIGNTSTAFKGNYDGNNYIIKNLKTLAEKDSSNNYLHSYQGLFGYADGATIRNINMFTSTINGLDHVGGIVGYSQSSTIENCRLYGSVNGNRITGGICGSSNYGTIRNCYVNVQVKATSSFGWFIGSGRVTISSCAYIYSGTGIDSCNAIVGSPGGMSAEDCYIETTALSISKNSNITITNTLAVLNGVKKYSASGTFYNWVILNGKPMPIGLTWVGNVGVKVTSVDQIIALGYSTTF